MSDYTKALNYAFLLLKYRSRSRFEIISRLKQKKHSLALATIVVAYLEENGYINDAQFAAQYAAALYARGYGKRRIELTLRRLGVGSEDIVAALVCDDARELLGELIRRKIKHYQGKKNAVARMVRVLVSRGFSYPDIIREMKEQGISRYED